MAYNQEYPYVDAQMFNIDWVLAKIKELEQAINLDSYKYIGENIYTDWNQAEPQTITYIPVGSLALNQAMTGASGLLFTNGNPDNLEQRFYAFSSGDMWYRSARNGVWLMWTNKDDDSSLLKGLPQSSTFNANNAVPNTYLYAYASPTNFPSGVSAGLCINYKTLDNGILQVVYPTVGTDSWKRIKTNDGVWGTWMNVNDYSNFFKAISRSGLTDANLVENNSFVYVQNISNTPEPIGYLFHYNSLGTTNKIQLFYSFTSKNFFLRVGDSNSWENWIDLNQYNLRSITLSNFDVYDMPMNTYAISNNFIGVPEANNRSLMICFGNLPSTSAMCQLYIGFTSGKMFMRSRATNTIDWGTWTLISQPITTNALLSTQHTDLYSTALSRKYNTMSTKESTKGSSFMHADTGYESFADAILRRDLSDKDMVVTNLEMWDMDTPVNELTAKVSEVVTHIKETSPLTGFTLYSLPPIDVPFFGEELYTYEWPSGNTLTEVDEALLDLSQEMGFKYITWREYKYINDNNLLTLYDDLFNNDLYQHSLQSYIESTI